MTEPPENRRPLKSRGTGWAQGLASGLAKAGASPDMISAGSIDRRSALGRARAAAA